MGESIEWGRRGLLWAAVAGAAVPSALLSACGGGGSSSSDGAARLRLFNVSNGYPSLDLRVDDVVVQGAVAYGAAGSYSSVSTASISTVISSAGSSTALSTASRTLAKDVSYTLLAYGWAGALKTAILQDDVAGADAGKAKLQVLNLAADAGTLDIYLTGNDDLLDDATALTTGLAGGATLSHTSISAGSYRLRVTGNGDKTDVRLDVTGLALTTTQVASLVLVPGAGGVLVHAVLAVQLGAVTALSNRQARVRVVSAVGGNGRVTAALGGSTLASAVTSPTIGNYGQVTATGSALPVVLSVNGSAVAVADVAVAAGGDYTLLVWGTAAAPQTSWLVDDNRLPATSGNAKVRLVHAVAGLDAALTLTADFSAIASSVAVGQASAFANVVASSAMRLEVNSPLSTNALYTLSSVAIAAKGLYTVFMLGDATAPVGALRKER
jgi:hypothetical protein